MEKVQAEKPSYEQLEREVAGLKSMNNQLIMQLQQMNMGNLCKRLDYLFKVLEVAPKLPVDVLNPEFVIADEPVSALDASIQAQIINLIKDMKQEYDITMLFISHDLNVIRYLADRIGIMYLGELVETGTRDEIFNNPQHPYTKLLLNSIPNIHKQPDKVDLTEIPSELPKGCKFYPRCHNVDCLGKMDKPVYKNLSPTHKVLCCELN